MNRRVAPYGSWKSPITSAWISTGATAVDQPRWDGEDLYWVELRPREGGRCVVVQRAPDGRTRDRFGDPFNARTRIHEYGGGAYLVDRGILYFSHFPDQRLYRQEGDAAPQPLTGAGDYRYADCIADRRRQRLVCVREDHSQTGREPVNTVVAISTSGEEAGGTVLVSGSDFFSSPCLSPDGNRLAWLSWKHPNMPWDGTELWTAELGPQGQPTNAKCVAGGPSESIFQPAWSPDGTLHFVSDRTGWWNLYRWRAGRVEALCPMEAEFGEPQWVFGLSTYAFLDADRLLCAYSRDGRSQLGLLDASRRRLDRLDIPYTYLTCVVASGRQAAFIGSSPSTPAAVVQLDADSARHEVVRSSSQLEVDPGYLSTPESIEFPTEGGLTAHALYYAPSNRDYAAPDGELPPLLVKSHGGPTSACSTRFNPGIQFWTSRGFAVVDVNYGGSSGYGRAYRDRLNGTWGVVDVDDCANAARFLVARGLADKDRLAIDGGSAGGYTTLCALTFRRDFKAGASYFGVSDLAAMARDTHKFESRYLDRLIGPYPEMEHLYRERSPIHFTERLSCPVILLQGLEDKVVPPNQAELMVDALRKKGLPVAYVPFEGEQHGFRRAENIRRALDAEFYFYSRIFDFSPADPIDPVPIENL